MNNLRRVSVFGGREITKEIYDNTVLLGEKLGNEGYTVFCGGGKGVMEAISKGVKMVDGLVIGILNGQDGTLSEIAYAFQLNKPVIGYATWDINPIIMAKSPDEVMSKLKREFECLKSA